jgi:3-hydroxyisobutyrate dehydrogenase
MARRRVFDHNRFMSELSIGFVGLGNMGGPMAANLHAAGFPLIVRDADAERQAGFAAGHAGVVVAAAPGDFAAAAIVITMLPDGAIVADALLNWGIGAALRPGAIVLEMSSSDPADTRRTAAELAARGVRVVDAPVSGGVPRAVTGKLSLMVGGDDADVAQVQPVLRVLGDPAIQFRTGALGTGHAMKALNNVIGAATYCATAEALVAGARFGLDPKTMIDIINASTARSFASESTFAGNVLTGAYASGFTLGLKAKDVRIAQSIVAAGDVDAPVLALTDERWAQALGEIGPAADQSLAHQAWWDDKLSG